MACWGSPPATSAAMPGSSVHPFLLAEKPVDVVQPRTRQDALHAHAAVLRTQEGVEPYLPLVARREIDVPPLRGERDVPGAGVDQKPLPQPRPRGEDRHVPPRVGPPLLEHRPVRLPQEREGGSGRLEVVDEVRLAHSQDPAQGRLIHLPVEIRKLAAAVLDGPGHSDARPLHGSFPAQEVAQDRIETRVLPAPVGGHPIAEEASPFPPVEREAGLRTADVPRKDHPAEALFSRLSTAARSFRYESRKLFTPSSSRRAQTSSIPVSISA